MKRRNPRPHGNSRKHGKVPDQRYPSKSAAGNWQRVAQRGSATAVEEWLAHPQLVRSQVHRDNILITIFEQFCLRIPWPQMRYCWLSWKRVIPKKPGTGRTYDNRSRAFRQSKRPGVRVVAGTTSGSLRYMPPIGNTPCAESWKAGSVVLSFWAAAISSFGRRRGKPRKRLGSPIARFWRASIENWKRRFA